jgi:hypothetical protein
VRRIYNKKGWAFINIGDYKDGNKNNAVSPNFTKKDGAKLDKKGPE